MAFSGSTLGNALTEVRKNLDEMRLRIRELKDQRAIIYAAPLPKQDAIAALDRVMGDMSDAFRAEGMNIALLARRDRDPSDFRLVRRFGIGEDLGDRLATGALWALLGPAMRQTVIGEIDAWYAASKVKPMSNQEREAALARIDHEIASREAHAEELADSLEDAAAAARA